MWIRVLEVLELVLWVLVRRERRKGRKPDTGERERESDQFST